MFNNPFSFQKKESGVTPYPEGLPSGAVVIFDFTSTDSFTSGDTTVYDLSGNGFNGTLLNGVGSGSDGGTYVTFPNTNSVIDIGGTTEFYSYWDFNPNMFVGVEFKTDTVATSSEVAASTWGGSYGTEQFFMMLPQTTTKDTRVGVQIYNDGGGFPAGFFESSAGVEPIPTGSRTSYSMYATSGTFSSYFDNTVLATTSTNATKAFYYAASSGGKKVALGNRNLTGENYTGKVYKFIMYNRTLTSTELDDIETWMSS